MFSVLLLDGELSDLTAVPPSKNVYLYYQYRICSAPAYPIIAAPLHRGICAKAAKCKAKTDDLFLRRLTEYAGWTVHIAEAIPAVAVRESLTDYAPGKWDSLIQKTIQELKKIRPSAGSTQEYCELSRRTLASDWQSVFYALSREQRFRGRASYIHHLLSSDRDKPDELSPKRVFYKSCCDQF